MSGLPISGHQEILILVDTRLGIEVLEGENALHSLPGPCVAATIADIGSQLGHLDLSHQALIVRPHGAQGGTIRKGIGSVRDLERAIEKAARESEDGLAIVEPDLRAHRNLERRRVLTRLGRRLAERLVTLCPECGCPGYGRTTTIRGLSCAACDMATEQIKADIHGCPRCSATHRVHRTGGVDPMWCDYCNP